MLAKSVNFPSHLLSGDSAVSFNLFPAQKDICCQGGSQTHKEKLVTDFSWVYFVLLKFVLS